jgi:hypothetical protein
VGYLLAAFRAAGRVSLYRRTGNRPVRAKDAAVPGFRPKQHSATSALVKVDARISRHRLHRSVTAFWARQFTLIDVPGSRVQGVQWAPAAARAGPAFLAQRHDCRGAETLYCHEEHPRTRCCWFPHYHGGSFLRSVVTGPGAADAYIAVSSAPAATVQESRQLELKSDRQSAEV